jgi:N-formylglutamate amidohydrolase
MQLELVQSCYMDEESLHYDEGRAAKLGETIREMLWAFMKSAKKKLRLNREHQ